MPRTYKKLNKRVTYDLQSLQKTLHELKRGNTLRDVEKRYKIPKSTLSKYRNVEDVTTLRIGGGRKTKLSKQDEDSLAKYLHETGKYGYGLSKSELLHFVKEFCEDTGIAWNESGPGREWYEGFMRRHPQLSIRKGEIMSSQRMRGADPFSISNWYKQLTDLYKRENISPLDGHRIFT